MLFLYISMPYALPFLLGSLPLAFPLAAPPCFFKRQPIAIIQDHSGIVFSCLSASLLFVSPPALAGVQPTSVPALVVSLQSAVLGPHSTPHCATIIFL